MTLRCLLGHARTGSAVLLALAIGVTAPAARAITPIGSSSLADNGSSIAVSRPADVQEGDLIVGQVAFRGGSGHAITAPAGWTLIRRTNGSDLVQAGFYKVAGASEPTSYTWSVGGSRIVVTHSAYRGVDPDAPIAADSGRTGSGTTVTATSVTVNNAPTRLLGLFAAASGGAAFDSAPAGTVLREAPFTQAGETGTRTLLADEEISSDGATGDRQATAGADAPNIGQLIALRPAPAGQPTALLFSVQPSDTTFGQAIAPAVEVQVIDADGVLVSSSTAEITIAIDTNPAGGTLSGTTTLAAVDGTATFPDLTIDEIGNGYTLRASAPDLDPDVSEPFDILVPDQDANAFDPDTPAGEVVGEISTRTAGAPFKVDVVAIDSGQVNQSFDDTVDVWLLDASENSGELDDVNCRDSWSRIQKIGTIAFDGSENGRAQLTGIEEPESWRELRIQIERIQPPGQAGVIGCSNDAFAIRPSAFAAVSATDTDRATAGSVRVLDATGPGDSPVHYASAPFSLEARAVNVDGITTQNYDGAPSGEVTCIEAGRPCVDGTFDTGAWTVSSGLLSSSSAVYDEVGAFELILEDRGYAAVDADDSTESERFVRSDAALGVGRFIPEHFVLRSSSLIDRIATDEAGCPSSFTYIGEAFEVSLALAAENAAGELTQNYEGGWARLTTVPALDFGAVDNGNNLTSRLNLPGWQGDWDKGELAAAYRVRLERGAPSGPFHQFEIGIRPVDADGVRLPAIATNLDVDGAGDHAKLGETGLRFGRLVAVGAGGAEIAPIDMPIHVEYWTGDTWRINDADHCTALALASEVRLDNGTDTQPGDQPIAVGSGQTSVTTASPIMLSSGLAEITFAAPGAGNTGWVDATGLLAVGAPSSPFLRGDPEGDGTWTTNPTGRVTFGIYSGSNRWIDVRRVPAN